MPDRPAARRGQAGGAGNASAYDGVCPASTAPLAAEKDTENISTTNLTVADKWATWPSTPSRSSRPAAPAWWCPAADSCSTTK